MAKFVIAALACAMLTGCGTGFKVKTGPIAAGAEVGPRTGIAIGLEDANGNQPVGLDVHVDLSSIIGLLSNLF